MLLEPGPAGPADPVSPAAPVDEGGAVDARPDGAPARSASTVALCACLGVTACGGCLGSAALFRALFLPGPPVEPTIAAGLALAATPLVLLPGILAGARNRAFPLLLCVAAALALLFPSLLHFAAFGYPAPCLLAGYGLAAAGACFFGRRPARPENATSLRRMAVWSLVLAMSLALMGSGMLYETGVSQRVTLGGALVAWGAAFAAFAAFFGILRPWLFSPLIYLGFVLVWLIVPVAGLEAYMYAEGISLKSAYAVSDWKWTYLFCATAGVSAIRLLILRQDLIRKRSFFADWT